MVYQLSRIAVLAMAVTHPAASSPADLGALPQTPPSALGRQGVGLKKPQPHPLPLSVFGGGQASRVKASPGPEGRP